ncbi:salicylate hydroxylase [Daldinia loculata]|uniref:salicylate hydroxylase n=1 Tax=Daldinia loculata TaxID=103429 RepID=UPI0020C55CD5|nr:salicylate hydroxylase [Daldinia loculata]KAI1642337.1 salicylate hydroxylase [Daldinia loculata]
MSIWTAYSLGRYIQSKISNLKGLAGAALANALVRVPQVDFHVFESAPTFSERGAAVGLAKNAQLALDQILPSGTDVLDKAGTVPMNSSRIILGSGPEEGTIVFDLAADDPGMNVHRASLLCELLTPLPKEALHPNKKLTTINPNESGVEISFQDDTVYQFDAVIGADGIFSTVREHVLQGVKAKSILGEKYLEVDRQYGWVGDGAFIMHDILENGTMVQCVVSGIEKDPSTSRDRKRPLTQDVLRDSLSSWLGGPIADGMISVSSGAGLAIEDAMVLGTLFANISSPSDINAAFEAYDLLRRPRCQRVIDSSRETGQILCGQVDLHANELRGLLAPRWNFIFELDMESHKREAVDKLRDIQQKS